VVAALLIGCGDDDEPTPEPNPISLEKNVDLLFSTTFGGEAFSANEDVAVNAHRFELTLLKFYVSNIVFTKVDGSEISFPDPILVDLGSSLGLNNLFPLSVEPGDYQSVRFAVGLDEETNATNAEPLETSNALSSSQNMWWGWASAYKFIMLEGRYDAQPLGTEIWEQAFAYHMGNDELYREVSIDFSETVITNELKTLEISIDLKEVFFTDNSPIDLLNEPTSHVSFSPFVVKLTDNFVGAIN